MAKITRIACAWLGGAAFALTACATAGPDFSHHAPLISEEEEPLGGEALTQRKHEMARAIRDMVHFVETLATLVERDDVRAVVLFDDFLAAYMGLYLDPMLRSEWQSGHPELMALDANLRFLKAQALIQMRYPRHVQQVIDEIERRYESRGSLLIDYPIGRQGTVSEGLELLKDRKWKG